MPYERLVLGTDNQPVAILRMNVRESLFRSLYREYEQTGRSFYIVNQRGVVQSATNRDAVGKPLAGSLGLDLGAFQGERGYLEMGDSVITYIHNDARGLYFLEDAPRAQYRAGFSSILQSILLVSLLCVVVCVALGFLMSRSFTKPLYRLIDRVRRIDGQSASARAGRNEIAILSDKYGQILSRLETLIADYYQEQQEKKEAQIRALEFQINPHFLYNTLSTIVWLIEAGQGRDAIRVTKDLSAFFRISISKGKEYIPLGRNCATWPCTWISRRPGTPTASPTTAKCQTGCSTTICPNCCCSPWWKIASFTPCRPGRTSAAVSGCWDGWREKIWCWRCGTTAPPSPGKL